MLSFKKWLEESEEKRSDEMFDQEQLEKRKQLQSKSKSKLINMKIDDFLDLAEKRIKKPGDVDASERKQKGIKDSLDSGEKLRTDDMESSGPYLDIKGENWGSSDEHQVVGHEGRHRALELKRRGYTHMPVLLKHHFIRWDQQTRPSSFDYKETWPTRLRNQDGDKVLPFPVSREEAGKDYE